MTIQRAEMTTVRWMCGIKITDRFTCSVYFVEAARIL